MQTPDPAYGSKAAFTDRVRGSVMLAGLGTWLLFVTEAGAQMIGWDVALPGLDQTDIDMIQHVGRVEMDGKPAGTVLEWSNPRSGASGTVTLVNQGTLRGMECRDLRQHFIVPNQAPWELESRICRQDDSSWKIMNQQRRPLDPEPSSQERRNAREMDP
jgi:surface antigen